MAISKLGKIKSTFVALFSMRWLVTWMGSQPSSIFFRVRLSAIGVTLALAVPGLTQAQNQSMEERLRAQLRSTTQQLQSLQSQQAQVNAAKVAAEAQRDAAQKEIEQLQAQLGKVTDQAEELVSQQEAVEQEARAQVAAIHAQRDQFKNAYDELLTMARATEAKKVSLQQTLAQRSAELTMCSAKNRELYDAGKEILAAYERFSTGDLLKIRQPFAGSARVKFEEQAQLYGDKLYRGQFDSRQAISSPAAMSADSQF
mgnify:FL=1